MRWALLAVCLSSVAASAWPVDMTLTAKVREETFQRLTALDWAAAEDPSTLSVEALPAGEALLTGKKDGETLVVAYLQGRIGVWRVRVGECGADGGTRCVEQKPVALETVKAACKDLNVEGGELTATVSTDACRAALMQLFQTDAFPGGKVELTFELKVLQAQLQQMQAAVDKAVGPGVVKLAYVGAGLRASGQVTQAQKTATFFQIFRHAVGHIALDDQLTVPGSNDEGTKTP